MLNNYLVKYLKFLSIQKGRDGGLGSIKKCFKTFGKFQISFYEVTNVRSRSQIPNLHDSEGSCKAIAYGHPIQKYQLSGSLLIALMMQP